MANRFYYTWCWPGLRICFVLLTCFSINAAEPVALIISCPPNVTLACGDNTSPSNTGNPNVTDPCDPTPTISYYDYAYTPPVAGSELRWVLLHLARRLVHVLQVPIARPILFALDCSIRPMLQEY
jgi:hypothetical protein